MVVIDKDLVNKNGVRYRRFSDSRDGVLIVNSDNGQITDINPFLEKLLNHTKKELIGKMIWEVDSFQNICKNKKNFSDLLEKGHVMFEDFPLQTKEGEFVHVEFDVNSYSLLRTNLTQFDIRDISERKKAAEAENALRLLKQEQLKTAFIADATHELRTPLAIIKGNVDLATRLSSNVPKPISEAFVAINEEIRHLSNLLSDLTLLITHESEFVSTITSHKINFSQLISHTVKRCKAIAIEKQIDIELKNTSSVQIWGDESYLEKLFSNIIANAVVYGHEKGKVKVTVMCEGDDVITTICDDGIGISKEELPYIFDRFYRATKARNVNRNGTGLGLAISKWVTEAHGGTISVQSEETKGSVFTIKLPVAKTK